MKELPTSTHAAFSVAANELGMWSAARLFLEEFEGIGGDALRELAIDELGRDFPVLEAVFSQRGQAVSLKDTSEALVRAIGDARRVLVVGLETEPMDVLVDALPEGIALGLLTRGGGRKLDERRALANYRGRVEPVDLAELNAWAGSRSALVTFLYGTDGHSTGYVAPLWMRVHGSDVRTQFRALLGWDLLGVAPLVHPRWLASTSLEDFSELVGS